MSNTPVLRPLSSRSLACISFNSLPTAWLPCFDGVALSGFQMSAPHLRAAMELDCTRISRGEDTKEAVVERCITKMKECFETCQAVRMFYPPQGVTSSFFR